MPAIISRRFQTVTLLILAVALYCGWHTFQFLTDDAFIAFRYVANAVQGYGFVWNPPPFAPVEGYTSFLWVLLLKLIWQITGLQPPQVANILSLLFGYASLFLVMRFVLRMALPEALERHRPFFLILVLLGAVTNRTVLAWLSSGLETALFNFLIIWWLYEAFTPSERQDKGWLVRLCLSAALIALTRPDGLLFVTGTLVFMGLLLLSKHPIGWRAMLPAAIPLLVVPLHLVWRKLTYGQWLPNTYYAKYSEPWLESGLRYAASFILENGVWVYLIIAGIFLFQKGRDIAARREKLNWLSLEALLPIGVVLGHIGYYTVMIGGDHFEYRVYSYLVPLLFASTLFLTARLRMRPLFAYIAFSLFLLASYPVAWAHWFETRDVTFDKFTDMQSTYRPIAHRFPQPLRPLVAQWDSWQAWLNERYAGMRHHQHKALSELLMRKMPKGEEYPQVVWEKRPVISAQAVGVLSWRLPEVAVIDFWGLNDRVVARSPAHGARFMAHTRMPPKGYAECFDPNVVLSESKLRLRRRARPMTDQRIQACEEKFWERINQGEKKIEASEISRVSGGMTIEEIFANKGALAGKEVTVRGKVVKYNSGIMRRNFLHLQDGTGEAGSNNLTVTTTERTAVGEVITIKGTLILNREFGPSYKYPVLVEEARIILEQKGEPE